MFNTELERVQSATEEQKQDIAARVANFQKYEHSGDLNTPGVCFFCDKESLLHIDADGSGGGYFFNVLVGGEHKSAMYCNSTCGDHPLMWRESDGGFSYNEIVGEYGVDGMTPATTQYADDKEDADVPDTTPIRKAVEQAVRKLYPGLKRADVDHIANCVVNDPKLHHSIHSLIDQYRPMPASYSVGVIRGTEEKGWADTTFVVGRHDDVAKHIKGKNRSELFLKGHPTHEAAKSDFVRKYGHYNNFEYNVRELDENGQIVKDE